MGVDGRRLIEIPITADNWRIIQRALHRELNDPGRTEPMLPRRIQEDIAGRVKALIQIIDHELRWHLR